MLPQNSFYHFWKFTKRVYFRNGTVHGAEAVCCTDKGNSRNISGIKVALGISHIHSTVYGVPLNNQPDILALGKPGAAGALEIVKQVCHSGIFQKALNIAVLAVAYYNQQVFSAEPLQRFMKFRVEYAAVLRYVVLLITHAFSHYFHAVRLGDVRQRHRSYFVQRFAHKAVHIVNGYAAGDVRVFFQNYVP